MSFFDRSGEIPSAQPTLFEYFFDSKKLVWVPWVDIIPEYLHDPEKKFSEILVPTVDTVRTTWLLELMVSIKRPVVLVGETGTSKSATTANFLRSLDKDSTVSYLLVPNLRNMTPPVSEMNGHASQPCDVLLWPSNTPALCICRSRRVRGYVTAFLQTDLFLVYLLFCERKAVPAQ